MEKWEIPQPCHLLLPWGWRLASTKLPGLGGARRAYCASPPSGHRGCRVHLIQLSPCIRSPLQTTAGQGWAPWLPICHTLSWPEMQVSLRQPLSHRPSPLILPGVHLWFRWGFSKPPTGPVLAVRAPGMPSALLYPKSFPRGPHQAEPQALTLDLNSGTSFATSGKLLSL